jgi:hypothetical protein
VLISTGHFRSLETGARDADSRFEGVLVKSLWRKRTNRIYVIIKENLLDWLIPLEAEAQQWLSASWRAREHSSCSKVGSLRTRHNNDTAPV